MAWYNSAIFVESNLEKQLRAFLERIGFRDIRKSDQVPDDPGSHQYEGPKRVNVACLNDWTILFNTPDMFGAGDLSGVENMTRKTIWPEKVDRVLAETSKDCPVFAFLIDGLSCTIGHCTYNDGMRNRARLIHLGRLVLDDGPALAEERTLSQRDSPQFAVLQLMRELDLPDFGPSYDHQEIPFATYTYQQADFGDWSA